MSPESLANYKLQVYNPGSPFPSPQADSFKAFPTVSTNPENPLKLTFSNRKRSRNASSDDSEDSMSPKKRTKMMKKEAVKELVRELKDELRSDNEASMKTVKEDFAKFFAEERVKANVEMKTQFTTIQTQLATISQSLKQTEENKAETDARLKSLEERFDRFENAKNEGGNDINIEDTVKNVVGNLSDSTWKANLVKEVFEAEHGIIIHGVRMHDANDDARKAFIKTFLHDDMKASTDILNKVRIKEVSRLGSDNTAAKPPPILVRFGHPTERNLILPLSSNLKEGVDVDKNVPKIYQKKHREFKRHAWKLKILYNVKSQVVFDGCKLVIRYKKNDDSVTQYNWVIDREWLPEPKDLEVVLNTSSTKDPSKHDTPAIDTSGAAECNKTIIVTGVKDVVTRENVKSQIHDFIANEDHAYIHDIQFKTKNVVIIICKDWTGCNYLTNKYQRKELLGKPVYLTMFSETDPEN